MSERVDLLKGNIAKALFWLALPIMGSSLVHMAYNLVDTMWVGQLGSPAVTAVGTAGYFMWLGQGLCMITEMGGQVLVGQSIGEDNLEKARRIARESMQLMFIFMLSCSIISIIFRHQLISFFNLNSADTAKMAASYLLIVSLGHPLMGFNFANQGILAATGNSKTSFKYNFIGMFLNIVLDPLMIFGIGPFPRLGVFGAGIATVFSQLVVSLLFANYLIKDDYIYGGFRLFAKINFKEVRHIFRIGLPTSLFSIAFSLINMTIAKFVVVYGDMVLAVQRIGTQIESVTWMSTDGFSISTNSFTAQNYGAGNYDRVRAGFRTGLVMMTLLGLCTTSLLFFGAKPIFSIFLHEPDAIVEGVRYLKISALAQLFMCYDGVGTGAFNGLGKTRFTAATNTILNLIRIPLCFILPPLFGGVAGIWWAITISCIAKGVTQLTAFTIYSKRKLTSISPDICS